MDEELLARVSAGDAIGVANEHGLRRIGVRPGLGTYLRSLWARRIFTWTLATSRAYARNQNSYLGQLWSVLNPILWAAVYLLVFGVLLDTSRGVENFVAFLVVGVFMFRFTSSSISAGARSIIGNVALVRSLQFPRAIMPISIVLAELATLAPALGVLCVIVLLTGESLAWSWFLLPVAVLMLWLFITGCTFIVSRLVAEARDLINVIPFVLRGLMYVSGVFFSVEYYTEKFPEAVSSVLVYQPVAVYLQLARSTMLEEVPLDATLWTAGAGWCLLFLVGGFLFFWRAEERYGRD